MMSKKALPQFQSTVPRASFASAVRTDIQIHCETEPLLRHLLASLKLDDTDFSSVFETKEPGASQKKNTKSATNPIRFMVGVYLNLLLSKAKLDSLRNTLSNKEFDQHEMLKLRTSHPNAAAMLIDFSKKITPERALEFLGNLTQSSLKLHQDFVSHTNEHEAIVNRYASQYTELMNECDQQLQSLNHTLSERELAHVFKLLGEIDV